METEVLKEIKYKAGYVVRTELVDCGGAKTEMRSAYTPSGDYIGAPKTAKLLCVKYGLLDIQKSRSDHSTCSIGFNEAEQKWYGWSHRAIFGFGIGDRIFEKEYGDDDTLFSQHGREVIENMEHAKTAAINFANYVG